MFILVALAIYLMVSLFSYTADDPGWSHSGFTEKISNIGGFVGAWLADVFIYLFGLFAYVFPFMLAYAGLQTYRNRFTKEYYNTHQLALTSVGFVLTMMAGCALMKMHLATFSTTLPAGAGGVLGDVVATLLIAPFSEVGANLFIAALFLAGVTLFTGVSWMWLVEWTGKVVLLGWEQLLFAYGRLRDYLQTRRVVAQREETVKKTKERLPKVPPRIEPGVEKIEVAPRAVEERQSDLFAKGSSHQLPAIELLDRPKERFKGQSPEELEAVSRLVELKLLDFNIQAQVVSVHPGPVITRFELQPAPGVKVSQISNLAKDLARSLSVISVRIVEVRR